MFVLVAEPPGSGKSTLARPLASELGLPLLAKDDVKEALMGEMGVPGDVCESRRRRGPGHFEEARTEAELWDDHLAPLRLGPVVEVDTSGEVSISAAARRVRHFYA
jgi:hypothetical protein